MNDNVLKLVVPGNPASVEGVVSVLETAQQRAREEQYVKAFVIMLDDTGLNYSTHMLNAGMKHSEILALLTHVQHSILHHMEQA